MNIYEKELNSFAKLNKIAKKNGVVLFGSTFSKSIPIGELKQSFGIECDLYNRSITDLSVFDAEKLVDDCVMSIAPHKVLIQLGETDLERGYRTIPEIISAYEKLISKIRASDKHCKIVVVSVCENDTSVYPEELNKRLEDMAKKLKCQYADISPAVANESPSLKAFSMLKLFILDRISFGDVMLAAL